MPKKTDIAHGGSPLYLLRVALSRYLIEFQHDLRDLEKNGLEENECAEVKAMLKDAIAAFEAHAHRVDSVYSEIARYFRKYADIYAKWNGHEGTDSGKPELRRKEMSELSDQRRALFRKLADRQTELAQSGQLNLPFVESVRMPLAKLGKGNPDKFPRLLQATALFG